MSRIIFELDEVEDIKNQLETLIQKSRKIDATSFKKLVRPKTEFLDGNEKIVYECIKEKPGQSKQDVVDSLNSENSLKKSLSRSPVFKTLKSLVKRGMVVQQPDPSNIQRHLLYVNNENLIIRVEKEIKDFKKSYFSLIKKTNEEYRKKLDLTEDELKKSRHLDLDLAESYSERVADGLIKIFKQFITNYSLKAIFEWREQIKDLDSLNRLYLTVFQILNEMFSELIKIVPFDMEDAHGRLEYLQEGMKYSLEDAKTYVEMIPNFDERNIRPEFDSTMTILFRSLKMHTSWKDYREWQNEV